MRVMKIKTPLAVLSANTDVLAMMGTQENFVDSNRRQIKRLNALVEPNATSFLDTTKEANTTKKKKLVSQCYKKYR